MVDLTRISYNSKHTCFKKLIYQPAITCSKLTIETEQGVKYVHS